jgi:pyruvate dehydrogenase E2 component (dihydrolipoamide acetyltransferase)
VRRGITPWRYTRGGEGQERAMADRVRALDALVNSTFLDQELGKRAGEDALGVDDVSGGTFTVSSLATLPIDGFTPVLNPPQSAILGVSRVRDAARFEDGEVVRGRSTTLRLTFDYRVVDGAPAGRFLGRIAELLEQPDALI